MVFPLFSCYLRIEWVENFFVNFIGNASLIKDESV